MHKRGSAITFLRTHGWAVMLALVAIIALVYMGIINLGSYLPGSCIIAPFISCEISKLAPDGSITLNIKNEGTAELNNADIKIGDTDGECDPANSIDAGLWTTCTAKVAAGTTGGKFTDTVTFTYTDDDTQSQKKTGELLAIYGEPELPF